jgi:dTDP-4-dehydrorhamnose 3,5-epimerase
VIHFDSRGFLLETLRRDDTTVGGQEFAMSYASVTPPGEFRDRDRWHVHRVQTDRFVVALGEMILALYDARSDSPTRSRLEVVRMEGAPYSQPSRGTKREAETSLVSIPEGVYHCIGNLSAQPFLLINFPTELYNAEDEGRVPFREVPIDDLGGPFEWSRVETDHPNP